MNPFREWLDEFLNSSIPNGFTIGMGERIREARQEKGISQEDLAKMVYRRRASLSDMENGKMVVDAPTLVLLSLCLQKPISYFIPPKYARSIIKEPLDSDEEELLIQFRRIQDEKQRKIALNQIRVIADTE